MALIDSSQAPLLLLDRDLNVLAASKSFCTTFRIRFDSRIVKLDALGDGEWNIPQLTSLLLATVAGDADIDAYEIDLVRPNLKPCRLVLNAHRLDYSDPAELRVVLAVTDVTAARLAEKLRDDLVREKQILLDELQHRVANSLQIIASVLMQSARRVQSKETRLHLQDAHNRVMSIAALQRQLAVSTQDQVQLRAYFTDLCRSIGASMIAEPDELSLTATVDDSFVTANTAVSLGLVVTELVINALKHAFPVEGLHGDITVDYKATGADWALAVADNGKGMPANDADITPGLGTGIVQALSRQLDATVATTRTEPGTRIDITHTEKP